MVKFICILLLISCNLFAQQFNPNKPVQVIIPFAPGGSIDITFKQLQQYANQQNINLIVVYRPGAETIIGLNKLVDASSDGYTIGLTTLSSVAQHRLNQPEQAKHVTIITNVKIPLNSFVTHPNAKLTSMKDVVRDINNGRVIRIGQGSPGSRIAAEQLISLIKSKTEAIVVPYKGGGPSLTDLIGEHIEMSVIPFSASKPLVDAGRLKLLMLTSAIKFNEYKTDYVFDMFPNWENYEGHLVLINKHTDKNAVIFWNSFFKQYIESEVAKTINAKELNLTVRFGEINSIEKLIQNVMKKM